jgi:hypothetical protein
MLLSIILLPAFFLGPPTALASATTVHEVGDCDVLVVGGNMGGVAAAIAAADAGPDLQICYTDITDSPGGQATAGGTSAIDFGKTVDNFPANLPHALGWILSHGPFGNGTDNRGGCSVSIKCFLPEWFVSACMDAFARRPNLRLYLSTVVTSSTRDAASGRVISVTATQRSPMPGTTGYDRLQSEALPDWYSAVDSAFFSKAVLSFTLSARAVVIEASEFGDVLVTSGVRVAQGVETPWENSTAYDQGCGQATTVVFWQSWGHTPAPRPDTTPLGGDAGFPFHYENSTELNHSYIWRRSVATVPSDRFWPRPGDTFMLNQFNDVDAPPPVLLPLAAARAQVAAGAWVGGVDLAALSACEQRAFGYYWVLVNSSKVALPSAEAFIFLNKSAAGTATGLAKMPYLREARRGQFGVEGFRLCKAPMAVGGENDPGCWMPPSPAATVTASAPPPPLPSGFGFKWNDTIAIGQYDFDIHMQNCTLPSYLDNYYHPAAKYYLPFRALTHWDSPNLLLAGKNIAQTFYANAATRLHPEEWATGAVSGVAAALMVQRQLSSLDLYLNVTLLQGVLRDKNVVPLEWT